MRGKLKYLVSDGSGRFRLVNLTICSDDDSKERGIARLRRKMLIRLLEEASGQGVVLSHRDLSMIMLASRSTIKRDLSIIRRQATYPPHKSS